MSAVTQLSLQEAGAVRAAERMGGDGGTVGARRGANGMDSGRGGARSSTIITARGRVGARSRADGMDGGTIGARSWMIGIVS